MAKGVRLRSLSLRGSWVQIPSPAPYHRYKLHTLLVIQIIQGSPLDIHHYDKRLEQALVKLKAESSVLEENKKTILSYIKYRQAQGLSIPRQVCYIFTLRKLSTLLPNRLENANKDDLVSVISQIEREDTSFEMKRTEKECIKCFYRRLKRGEEGEEYPLEV